MSKKAAKNFYALAHDWLWFARRGHVGALGYFARYRRMARVERLEKLPVYKQDPLTKRWSL